MLMMFPAVQSPVVNVAASNNVTLTSLDPTGAGVKTITFIINGNIGSTSSLSFDAHAVMFR